MNQLLKNNRVFVGLAALLAALLVLSLALALAGCGGGEQDDLGVWEYTRDIELPDFATQVSLPDTNYAVDFDEVGIGYVTVEQHIDGDTVHFWNNSHSKVLKVRFQGIDTPESTGKVEPWGKPASIYTKTKLKNAEKIVLQSDEDGVAKLDSTGARYLAWVWYRNKGETQWRNLNIEILSDGLAVGKSTLSTRYGETAVAAITSARQNNINMHSGEHDPLFYYGDAVELSIKALVTNRQSYSGIKVRFEGVVVKKSGEGVYVQAFDEDTQQNYGVYVYGGYNSLAPNFLKVGNRLQITGTADNNETFGFQVSGLSFSYFNPTADDTKILAENIEVDPVAITYQQLTEDQSREFTYVQYGPLTVTSIYTTQSDTSSDGAMTLTCRTQDGETVTVRTVRLTLDGQTVTEDYFRDKTLQSVVGIVEYYNDKPQIKLFTLSDVEFAN